MAVVLVLVFGVLAAALASYGAVSFRFHRVVRQQTALRASAEAGLRYGLEKLRLHQTLCADVPGSLAEQAIEVPITPNDATVTVSCAYAGGNLPAANEWALILTGVGASSSEPSFQAHGSSSVNRTIEGPVFMEVTTPASTAFDLAAPVKLLEGDLWYQSDACTTAVAPSQANLTITPSPPRGRLCTAHTWQDLAPMPPLPTKPLPVDPSGRDDLVPGCRIFFPGAYAAPPALGSDNYFISGDYYFEFNDTIEVRQADVVGGQPSPYSEDVQYLADLAPGCAGVLDNDTVAAAETGWGVTWILGGGSRIDVGVHGRIELFSRAQADQDVSIQAVETSGSGYTKSTVNVAAGPIISMKEGNTTDMVVHGLIRAPEGFVEFGNVTNTVSAVATGGIVVAGIDLQGSASASGWVIGRSSRPSATKIVMLATATDTNGVSVSMKAVADYRLGRSVNDAVTTNGSQTVTSATAAFTDADVGSYVLATTLPGGTTITAVQNSTTITVSQAATATRSGIRLVIRTAEIAINSWRKV
jgi:hypothetical protein